TLACPSGHIPLFTGIRLVTPKCDGCVSEAKAAQKALGTNSHRGQIHCLPHMVNSSSRPNLLCRVVTEQIEHQRDQKQDADGSHLVLHSPHAFRLHSLITPQADRDSGNGVWHSRRAGWKARPCSPGGMGLSWPLRAS